MKNSKLSFMKCANVSLLVSLTIVCLSSHSLLAEELKQAENLAEFFQDSKLSAYLRPRYEFVDQDNLDNNANAYTLLSRIGIESASYQNVKGVLELQNVSSLAEETFNNTINNKSDYPVVADPESSSFYRAYLEYAQPESFKVLYGRRPINLDNQRFVGQVGWRQNNQTFDGADLTVDLSQKTKFNYHYVSQVNRIFGEDSPQDIYNSEIHLLNSSYNLDKEKKFSVFSYLDDLENADNKSNVSSGIRSQLLFLTDRAELKIPLEATYAYQNEYADNPDTFSNHYFSVESGVVYSNNKLKVGYESLGSDGKFSFQTPLATLHAFNGWADMFLTTPEKGLQDLYLYHSIDLEPVSVFQKGIKIETVYHNYTAEYGNLNYGQELDFAVINNINDSHSIGLHYANYFSDQLYPDTQKFWFSITSKIDLSA